jgi:hypothetical protein
MTAEEHVKKHYPEAKIEDDGYLYRVMASKNGMGFMEIIGTGITAESAWDEAWEWVDLNK